MCENPKQAVSKSFAIDQDHLLTCNDANNMIGENLQDPKRGYKGCFQQINCLFLGFFTDQCPLLLFRCGRITKIL